MSTPTIIYTDGGSRKKQTESACSAWFRESDLYSGKYLGTVSNNVAEYAGVILALRTALRLGHPAVQLYCDSQLIVNQIKGTYKINNETLRRLNLEVCGLSEDFKEFYIDWVPREDNAEADAEVNRVLDSIEGYTIWDPLT